MKNNLNSNPKYQRGEGLFSILLLAFVILGVLILGAKIGPTYLEYRRISSAMDETAKLPEAYSLVDRTLINRVDSTLRNDLRWIDLDLHKVIKIRKRNDLKIIDLDYEIEIPLVWVASILLHYEHEAEVQRQL